MAHKEETKVEQLHDLWVCFWAFMLGLIKSLDSVEVEAAAKDPEHPFWTKLREAFDALKHKFQAELSVNSWFLSVSRQSPAELLKFMETDPNMKRHYSVASGELSPVLVGPDPYTSEGVTLKFLVFNAPVSLARALKEVRSKNLTVAPPPLALRFARDFAERTSEKLDIGTFTGGNGDGVTFIDVDDLSKSIRIDAGSMGGWDVALRDFVEIPTLSGIAVIV